MYECHHHPPPSSLTLSSPRSHTQSLYISSSRASQGAVRPPRPSGGISAHTTRFMIPSDDTFRMVEDEFLHVAQRFTTHLYRAEYSRLKALAKSQNAAAIHAIERPVIGPATRISKHRSDALHRAARQANITDDEPPPWMATGLRGLMDSPRKEARTIRSYAMTVPGTRAAAGFGSRVAAGRDVSVVRRQVSTSQDESDEADDLGGPSSIRPPAKSIAGVRSVTFQTGQTTNRPLKQINRVKSEPNLKHPSRSDKPGRARLEDNYGDDDDDDPFGIKKRKIRRAQSREQLRKPPEKPSRTTSPDLIPTFL